MAEVAYDLPRGNLYKPTSHTVSPLAGLAKQALSSLFGLEAFIETQQIISSIDTSTSAVDNYSTYVIPSRDLALQPGLTAEPVPGDMLTHTFVDMSDEMSSDQYLVFLSIGDAEEFLLPLIQRIGELTKLAGEEEDQRALKPQSLRGFFRFLYLHRSRIESRPQLILTTEGHLRAIWRKSRDHRVAIRFIDQTRVSFVTFLPDYIRPTQINRVGGDSSVDSFFKSTGIQRLWY